MTEREFWRLTPRMFAALCDQYAMQLGAKKHGPRRLSGKDALQTLLASGAAKYGGQTT